MFIHIVADHPLPGRRGVRLTPARRHPRGGRRQGCSLRRGPEGSGRCRSSGLVPLPRLQLSRRPCHHPRRLRR